MQQPGPATKVNMVRQLHISRGSSPLTQPLISLPTAAQSPYLYLPGISVHTSVGGGGGVLKQWAVSGAPFPSLASQVQFTPHELSVLPSKTSSLSACEGWQVCFLHTLIVGYTRSNIQTPPLQLSMLLEKKKSWVNGRSGRSFHRNGDRSDEESCIPQRPLI